MVSDEIIKKYSSKKLGWLLAETQKRVNKYIRIRDIEDGYFKCISCDKTFPAHIANASHFYPVGHYPSVRFNLDNIFVSCQRCNLYLYGNLAPYSINLMAKIGKKRFDELSATAKMKNFKWDRIIVIHILEKFKDFK